MVKRFLSALAKGGSFQIGAGVHGPLPLVAIDPARGYPPPSISHAPHVGYGVVKQRSDEKSPAVWLDTACAGA